MSSPTDTEYRDTVYDASSWRRLAKELVESAKLIEPKLDDFWLGVRRREWNDAQVAVYFMLCAYALENLLKAKIVEKFVGTYGMPGSVQELPKDLLSHDLVALAGRCANEAFVEEHASVLMRLTRCSTWYGRYSAPTKVAATRTTAFAPSGREINLTEHASIDRNDIHRLLSAFGLQTE